MWGRDDVDEHSERNNIKIYGDEANREEAQHKSFFFETNNFERFALYGGGRRCIINGISTTAA